MIEIYVASYNGRAPSNELSGWFGPEGGTLGRGADNRLVLPDPARHVSRTQARIRFDGTGFFIANISEANPLFVNDTEIDSGSEVPLVAGAELRIGLYVLAVRATAPGGASPAATKSAGPTPSRTGAQADPFSGLGGTAVGPNPFEDLLGAPGQPPIAPPVATPMTSPAASSIPPSAPPPVPAPRVPAAPPAASVRDPAPRQEPRLERPLSDPFADLLQPNTPPRGEKASAPAAADPFADLLRGSAPSLPSTSAPGSARKPAAGAIPDDFDPFAMPSSAPRNTDDPLRDLAASSIDLNAVGAHSQKSSLLEFDLAPKANPRDPLQGGTPSLVDSQAVVDPLRLFGGSDNPLARPEHDPLGQGMPMPDKIPEIGAHFTPPKSAPESPARAALIPESGERVAPIAKAPLARPTPVSQGSAPVRAPQASAAQSAVPQAPATAPPPVASVRAGPSLAAREARDAGAAGRALGTSLGGAADGEALLAAFLKGARVADLSGPTRLTPALMELLGTLVYEATAGAMELIAARKITKREMRAEVTMIVAQGNNPLKFLPTPEAAILQMLGPKMPGFMTTGEAMQDAFDDLRAHEVGMIAGMRAALAEVLRRFDPAMLEERLGKSDLFDTLLPAARRAKLWNLFEARFHELYREANDDFQSLFGEAFIKAYEEQIENERIRRGRP